MVRSPNKWERFQTDKIRKELKTLSLVEQLEKLDEEVDGYAGGDSGRYKNIFEILWDNLKQLEKEIITK